MTWDYAIGQEVIRIERVNDDGVVSLVAEIPLACAYEAEAICNAHNQEHGQ